MMSFKGNVLAEPGHGDAMTTGELAQGVTERCLPGDFIIIQRPHIKLGYQTPMEFERDYYGKAA